jgi:hypothetical protein
MHLGTCSKWRGDLFYVLATSLLPSSKGLSHPLNRRTVSPRAMKPWSSSSYSHALLTCIIFKILQLTMICHATAQAVIRQLPTAAARARSQFRSWRICCGQSSIGAVFLHALQFLLPVLIPPTSIFINHLIFMVSILRALLTNLESLWRGMPAYLC